jgi:uncharacterized protein (DUF2267 family)
MTFDEFTGQVQHRARLASTGDSLRAIRATLTVLGQRLFGGEAYELSAQLPEEIKLYLQQAFQSETFGLAEFYQRVADLEGADMPEAVFHARAVISVLMDAVSPGEIRDMLDQLPSEYASLFNWEGTGEERKAA